MFLVSKKMNLAFLPFSLSLVAVLLPAAPACALAQVPAAARATPQRGTVKSIDGSNLTLTTDAGQPIVVTVLESAHIQRLAPGSTDLKTAEMATLPDVAVGDRILVTGTPGDSPSTFVASRVILMKSADIAQRHEAEQQNWKRGTGGIVSAVDPASGAITVTSGARKLQVTTDAKTSFRRYADGSVKFEDAKPGTLGQIQAGDQMLARGSRSADGASLTAEEIVSGSFKNLSGTIVSIDVQKSVVSLKDLVTKRTVMVQLTPNSAVHRLPPETAARLAARANAGASAGAAAAHATSPTAATTRSTGETPDGDHPAGGTGHAGGGDLSQVVARLPAVPLTDVHTGDSVMIVAEQSSTDAGNLTAITLLAGVEPLLAAASGGSTAMTLSPWSVGTGAPEGGGSQ